MLTILLGLAFLITQLIEYAHVGFNTSDGAFASVFFGLTGLHGAHVFIGLSLLTMAAVRAFRGHFSPEHYHGVEIPGHLLALRRHHVDRRLHGHLPALRQAAMRNPFRSEAEAFRLVWLSLVYFGLIVVAAAIAAWLGLVVFLVLTAVAVWLIRGGRREPPERVHVERGGAEGERRILVIANETVGGEELRELLRKLSEGVREEILVVCPALNSRLRHWASDEDPGTRGRAGPAPRQHRQARRGGHPARAARSATPIRCRRWRTRCVRSGPTRSSSPPTRPVARTGSSRGSSKVRASASTCP